MLTDYNKFEYRDVPDPQIRFNEVLLQVKVCGICGSDVHGMDGSTGRRQPPIIMGHEAAGVIVETGSNVESWKNGERVTFDSTIFCGECFYCDRGQVNLCDNRRVAGVACDDYHQDGAMAEYIAIPERILYALPESLSYEEAAMVEALSVAFHAVRRTTVRIGDTAIVLGAGIIGLLIVQSLRISGAGKIVTLDLDDSRLSLAEKLGADVTVNSSSRHVADIVKRLTDGRGADLAFEAVGISSTVQLGIELIRKGGRLCLVGNLSKQISLPLQSVVTREISLVSSCASSGEYPACLKMIADGKIDVKSLISGTPHLSEGESWFKRLHAREYGLMKIILMP